MGNSRSDCRTKEYRVATNVPITRHRVLHFPPLERNTNEGDTHLSCACHRYYLLAIDPETSSIWSETLLSRAFPFFFPRPARYAMTVRAKGHTKSYTAGLRGHCGAVSKACRRQIIRKEARYSRFLPFLFYARCLPYGRFDLYVGVDYN